MQFQKDGILIDVNKKHIKIFFENEEQKQKFDSKFVNFFKMKYPGRVVISDIISNQSLTKMMEIGNYDILDNMRSVLKKGIKTLGILMVAIGLCFICPPVGILLLVLWIFVD